MANLNFAGKITHISAPQTGEGKNGSWTKTTFIVEEVDGQYPNSLAFDAFNKQELVDLLLIDRYVEVFYNSKATEVNGRCFNNNSVWKVEIKDNVSVPQATSASSQQPKASAPTVPPVGDDLPF